MFNSWQLHWFHKIDIYFLKMLLYKTRVLLSIQRILGPILSYNSCWLVSRNYQSFIHKHTYTVTNAQAHYWCYSSSGQTENDSLVAHHPQQFAKEKGLQNNWCISTLLRLLKSSVQWNNFRTIRTETNRFWLGEE